MIYYFLGVIGLIILMAAFVYYASRIQMKAWLTELENFLINKYQTNKKENGQAKE